MSFTERAKKRAAQNDRIFEGREKVGIGDIIMEYPEGITVTDFTILHDNTNDSDYCVIAFEEEAKAFFFGGTALTGLFKDVVEKDFDGDLETAREELKTEGGMKLKLSEKRSKNGRNYTAFEVLD